MNCNKARQHWNLYHDSEGDAELHFQISEHLAVCADCAEWFGQQSQLEGLLVEKLKSKPSSPDLWNDVLSRAGLSRPQPIRRWLQLAGMAACLAGGVLVSFLIWKQSSRLPTSDLAMLSAERHERFVSENELPQFESRSDVEVEDYLRKRVAFPVRCPPRKDAGFAVRGAGVSQIEGQPAAYINGTVGDSPVSILILPRDSLSAFPVQQTALRKHGIMHTPAGPYAMVLREFDQNAIIVVGRAEPAALERVVNAYGSYPDHD